MIASGKVRAGALKRLFARFDRELREKGYLAMGGQIVDATIVEIYAGGGLVTFTEQVFPAAPLDSIRVESRDSDG